MKPFAAWKKTLGDLDAETAAVVVAAAADVALVLDDQGVIRDVAFGSDELPQALADHAGWVGRRWVDTVTVESRPKVEALLKDAAARGAPRWRHLNYPGAATDAPILHAAIPVGRGGTVLSVGRSLGAIAAVQQRLVEAQQSLERDYLRFRQADMRYRVLFQTAAEATLVLEAASLKVIEANPAAVELFGGDGAGLAGRPLGERIEPESVAGLLEMLARVRAVGAAESVRARLADGGRECLVTASLMGQDSAALLLVRFAPLDGQAAGLAAAWGRTPLLGIVESAPDGIVVTHPDGRILAANRAFLALVQLATEQQARGESLDRWLGRSGVDLGVLTAALRQHGIVRLFATTLRGEYGAPVEVEISAVAAAQAGRPCLGFIVRDVARRIPVEARASRVMPRSVEQLTELVGRVSLKDIVREATDVIERLCIEAALELTSDNRASAAELLGLSRQSLYVKLHRYGLGELAAAEGSK